MVSPSGAGLSNQNWSSHKLGESDRLPRSEGGGLTLRADLHDLVGGAGGDLVHQGRALHQTAVDNKDFDHLPSPAGSLPLGCRKTGIRRVCLRSPHSLEMTAYHPGWNSGLTSSQNLRIEQRLAFGFWVERPLLPCMGSRKAGVADG